MLLKKVVSPKMAEWVAGLKLKKKQKKRTIRGIFRFLRKKKSKHIPLHCLKCEKQKATKEDVRKHLRKNRKHIYRLKLLKMHIEKAKQLAQKHPEVKSTEKYVTLKIALALKCATLVTLNEAFLESIDRILLK